MTEATGGKYKCTLTAALLKQAEDELNEKEKWRERDIQALRDMVLAHKGLKSRLDDEFLLRFLRARKFDYDRAYDLLINYYSIRAKNADIFQHLTAKSVEHVYNAGPLVVLQRRDKAGRRILYFRPGKWNPGAFPVQDLLRTLLVNVEMAIRDEQTQICGVVLIENMADIGLAHARSITHKAAKVLTSLLQEAFPMRLKGIHIVNEPAIFAAIFAIVKPLLKEKTVKRLHFHGSSLESLHKHFSVDVLPEELGGKLPPGDQLAKAWKAEVMAHPEVFENFEKYKIELPKDITKTQSSDPVDYLAGTYKKLSID